MKKSIIVLCIAAIFILSFGVKVVMADVAMITTITTNAATTVAYNQEHKELQESVAQSGCSLPINLANQLGCELKYTTYVGKFECYPYTITTDCNGTILELKNGTTEINLMSLMPFIISCIILGIFGFILLR